MMADAFEPDSLGVVLKVTERPRPVEAGKRVAVQLVPEMGPGRFVVSFGLPFPPGALADHTRIRAMDESGQAIPVFTRALALWWMDGKQGFVRSALVQFEVAFADTMARHVTLAWDGTRGQSRQVEVPTAETQFVREDADGAYRCPNVLALLPPEWLSESWVAWQQVAASQNGVAAWYDREVLEQFPGSLAHIHADHYEPHLYDRPATYAKIYVRHGLREHLVAALRAGDVYVSHLTLDGFFGLKPGDFKYVYAEGSALLYLLSGDDRFRDAALHGLKSWHQWGHVQYKGRGFWTERHAAFGMAAHLHAFELTGEFHLLQQAKAYFDGVYAMQTRPLDGRPPDGAWRHTAESHGDGEGWTTSPWMSALLFDSIWKYWMLTGDVRAPVSLAAYAKFFARYAISPGGTHVYYMAASPGSGQSINPENPPHHVEACYMLAMGYYLSGYEDGDLLEKYERLWPLVVGDQANRPPRKFSWRFRNTSMLVWLMDRERHHW